MYNRFFPMRVVATLLTFCLPVVPQILAKRIDVILNSTEQARRTFWGIHVVDAKTGAVVYRRNHQHFFVPASNTKLFSTSLGLMRLGPEHRFHTTIVADARPDADGRVREIRLVGGGDPHLSARVIPYRRTDLKPNAFEVIDKLADALVASGLKAIDGDVVGDDTAYVLEPYPEGWSVQDPIWEYGAPVSALTLNDNAFALIVEPAPEAGSAARIFLRPAFEHLTVHNRTWTAAAGEKKIVIERLPGTSELTVSGPILLNGTRDESILAIEDPALFAAQVLRSALLLRGVRIAGSTRALHRRADDPPPESFGVELARHTSQPLIEAIRIVNKVSQNLHAEIVLREVARSKDGSGSRKSGLKELASFLMEVGIDEKEYNFEDASGLSRLTLVTPAAITKLLGYMHSSPHREEWISTLPVAGEDGTLYGRFNNRPRPQIRAKTGTISHVSSLSGYASRKDGRRYIFSIVANNYNSEAAAIRKLIDRIALSLLN
jgi:serine-type D-Ala-D-Ala carboxypeptidase/endopeptidase (penicillin-binding protein 4)